MRLRSLAHFATLLALCVACALAGACRDKSKRRSGQADRAASAPRLARAVAASPAPASADRRSVGPGPATIYPRQVPLALAKGATPLDPPMRVLDVLAVPERDLAVVGGVSAAGPTIELVDVERGLILWIDATCGKPIVHTTRDRVMCGSARGIDAIDLDSGKAVWSSGLAFRAAHGGYIFAHDPADPRRGSVLDAESGEVVASARAPEGDSFDEVVRMCAGAGGFDLFAMIGTELRRIRVARGADAAETALRSWKRRLPARPMTMDLCDRVMLFELAGKRAGELTLLPVFSQTGTDAGASIAVRAWWPTAAGDGVVTATDAGVQLRARDLTEDRMISAARVGGRQVTSRGDRRLLRSIAGTLLLVDGAESEGWLAAPVQRKGAVLTSNRILVGPRLSTPQTEADYATLWELPPLPASEVGRHGPPLVEPPTRTDDAPKPQPLPEPTPPSATIELPTAGSNSVTGTALSGERLYALTLESMQGHLNAAGIAAFDLKSRAWLWHRGGACAAGAEAVGLATAEGVVVCGARRHYPGRGVVTAVSADSGEPMWEIGLSTVDAVSGAGTAIIAWSGDRATVIRAATGEILYELSADNGYAVRAVPILLPGADAKRAQTRVVSLEPGGLLVARDPAARGAPVWAIHVRGYAESLQAAGDRVAIGLAGGALGLVAARDGAPTVASAAAPRWFAPGGGALVFDDAHLLAGPGHLRGYGLDGSERLFASFAIDGPLELAELRAATADAPLVLVSHRGEARALVVEPHRGAVESVHVLPPRWVHGSVFGAVAGGQPIAGVVLQKPLAVQIF